MLHAEPCGEQSNFSLCSAFQHLVHLLSLLVFWILSALFPQPCLNLLFSLIVSCSICTSPRLPFIVSNLSDAVPRLHLLANLLYPQPV